MDCPKCQHSPHRKAGKRAGCQRFYCRDCHYYYTVSQRSTTKPLTIKRLAIEMYLEGLGFRAIGRLLNISYGTVYQWVKSLGTQALDLKKEKNSVQIVELDELHTYIQSKKTTVGYGLLLIDWVNGLSILSVDREGMKRGTDFGKE